MVVLPWVGLTGLACYYFVFIAFTQSIIEFLIFNESIENVTYVTAVAKPSMHAGIRHAVQPLRLGVRHVILNNGNNESRSLFTALHKVVIPAKKRSPLYSTAADSPQTPSEEDHDSKPFEIDTGHASSLDASPSVWSSSLWPEEHLDPGLFIVPTPIGNP